MWHFLRNFIHWQWKFRHLLWNITLTQKLVLSSGLMIFGVNFNKGRDQRGEESKFVWHYSNSGHIFRLSTGTKNSLPLFFQLSPLPASFHFYQLCLIAQLTSSSYFSTKFLLQFEVWMQMKGRREVVQPCKKCKYLEFSTSVPTYSSCLVWEFLS